MTSLALGLVLGTGLFCTWWACWIPEPSRTRPGRRPSVRDQMADDLRHAGLPDVGPGALASASVVVALVIGLAAYGLARALPIAVCFGLMASTGPLLLVRSRARRRRSAVRDVWPDAIDNLASAVRAGLELPEAVGQLAIRGPEDLRPAFAEFARDYRGSGRFSPALDQLKERLADPVADRVIEALRLAREVGGTDVGRLLRMLSAFLRQDIRTRAELRTRQGWTVTGARLAVAAPWIVLGLLATRPESVAAYRTTAGALVLLSGGVLSVVAYAAMLRIAALPEERRVLTTNHLGTS
ncbi:MAG: type II secretion system F family protein [Angustibacter sp.]